MKRNSLVWLLLAAAAGAMLPAEGRQQTPRSLDFYVQRNLRDFQASATVISKNDRELAKLGRDYIEAYNMQRTEFFFQEPGRVMMRGRRGLATVRFVTNGNRRLTEISTLRIRRVQDISEEPSRGEMALDFGVITPSVLEQVDGRFLRTEQRDGRELHVFELAYKKTPRLTMTVWLDARTRTVADRIDHHRAEQREGFKKRFVFREVQEFNGVSLPTRVDLYNPENKQAAASRYSEIKVNAGLDASLFAF